MDELRPHILELSRSYPGSAANLFSLWTNPADLLRWSELRRCNLDVRPGGAYRFEFPCAPGEEDVTIGTYLEVDPPHRLTFTWDGLSPSGPTSETLVALDFRDDGTACSFHLRHEFCHEQSMIECKSGWEAWLEMLASFLERSDAR